MKNFTKRLLFLLVICFSSLSAWSQYYYYNDKYYDREVLWEVGASIGSMHGLTDVGRKNVDLALTKLNYGLYGGFMYQDVVGARFDLTSGYIAGDDKNGRFKGRNLSYKTRINEVVLIGEFHPLRLTETGASSYLSPYVMLGAGAFSYRPKTLYKGQWIDLHSLRLEGQGFDEYPNRKQYNLGSLVVPFGLGLKYELSPKINVRLEGLMRHTFTDYLDDASTFSIDPSLFSKYLYPHEIPLAEALTNRTGEKNGTISTGIIQRGGEKTKDKYLTINLKVGWTIGRERIR